jgi:hypothetical protein
MKPWTTAVAVAIALTGASAHAATLVGTYSGDDCAGMFNGDVPGFVNCVIPADFDGEENEATPVIAKFEFDEEGNVSNTQLNPDYDSISGDEWTFDPDAGIWTYTQGDNDPVITFFAVKGGPSFNLYHLIADDDEQEGVEYLTPRDPNNSFYGLSHLTFYDAGDDGGEDPDPAPEPTALALLGLGLVGAGYLRRRRQ